MLLTGLILHSEAFSNSHILQYITLECNLSAQRMMHFPTVSFARGTTQKRDERCSQPEGASWVHMNKEGWKHPGQVCWINIHLNIYRQIISSCKSSLLQWNQQSQIYTSWKPGHGVSCKPTVSKMQVMEVYGSDREEDGKGYPIQTVVKGEKEQRKQAESKVKEGKGWEMLRVWL